MSRALLAVALGLQHAATPVHAASIHVSCPSCDDLPAWFLGLLAAVGVLLALAILWLPQRMARNIGSPRRRRILVLSGWLVLTIAFVVGVRALVLVLGGS